MFDEEERPQKKEQSVSRALDNMSIAELESYIRALRAEIERVEADIAGKKAHQEAASSVFKS